MSIAAELKEIVREAVREVLREELAPLLAATASPAAYPSPRESEPQGAAKAELLTLTQAARHLGLSQSTVRVHMRAGRIPFTRPGGKVYRFRRSDLDNFARSPGADVTTLDFEAQSRTNVRRALGR